MLTQVLGSIADSFRHRFGWPAHGGKQAAEYQETYEEERRSFGRHHDAHASGGHTMGNPDGGRPFGRNRHD